MVNPAFDDCPRDDCTFFPEENVDHIFARSSNINIQGSYSAAYKELLPHDVWETVKNCKFRSRSRDKWIKNPQIGSFFLQCLKTANAPQSTTISVMKSESRKRRNFLAAIRKGKLAYVGRFWHFGFEAGQLNRSAAALSELVITAFKWLKKPDDEVKRLFELYFCKLTGEDDFPWQTLSEYFGELVQVMNSGIVWKKSLMICKGAAIPGERTFGYVQKSDAGVLGKSLMEKFACVFVTDDCLNGKDANFCTEEFVDPKWFQATTLLHEITHLRLKTDDLKIKSGHYAYGRLGCAVLRREHELNPSKLNDPFNNADTLAYFACDLILIKKKLVSSEKVFKILDISK